MILSLLKYTRIDYRIPSLTMNWYLRNHFDLLIEWESLIFIRITFISLVILNINMIWWRSDPYSHSDWRIFLSLLMAERYKKLKISHTHSALVRENLHKNDYSRTVFFNWKKVSQHSTPIWIFTCTLLIVQFELSDWWIWTLYELHRTIHASLLGRNKKNQHELF